jgi:hypothetical protein
MDVSKISRENHKGLVMVCLGFPLGLEWEGKNRVEGQSRGEYGVYCGDRLERLQVPRVSVKK